ncbi:MAG: hypothetical protein ACFCGT_02450 [Sandaracinaceae bacterium]
MHRALCFAFVPMIFGCSGLGSVSEDVDPLEIVYAPDGTPAFLGQALMIESCGGGGFCHADAIANGERFGAPRGLTFDLRLAQDDDSTDRLSRAQQVTFSNRDGVWGEVSAGTMPPSGEGERVLEATRVGYERVMDDGVTFFPLPRLNDDDPEARAESRELLRNWLACGTPVVERTEPRRIGQNEAGITQPACERICVDPTWRSIYDNIIEPGCAVTGCHTPEDRLGDLDLALDMVPTTEAERAAAVERVLGRFVTPGGQPVIASEDWSCGDTMAPLLDRSAADPVPARNLLFSKVTDAFECGSRMPLAGNPLTDQRVCAFQVWIECGACTPGDGDAACEQCIADMRGTCGVVLEGGQPVCMVQPECPNEPTMVDEDFTCL